MTETKNALMKGGATDVMTANLAGARGDKAVERMVIDRMADYFGRLLRSGRDAGLTWTGTMTDLVEATHVVWLTGRFLAADGRPVTFRDLLGRACDVLHRRMPYNAHSLLAQATRRKNIRSCPVVMRYTELLTQARLVNPFQMDVDWQKVKI